MYKGYQVGAICIYCKMRILSHFTICIYYKMRILSHFKLRGKTHLEVQIFGIFGSSILGAWALRYTFFYFTSSPPPSSASTLRVVISSPRSSSSGNNFERGPSSAYIGCAREHKVIQEHYTYFEAL